MSDATKGWRWKKDYDDDRSSWMLCDPRGKVVIDGDMLGFQTEGGCDHVPVISVDDDTRARIAACLNACEGIPTDKLVAGEAVTKSLAQST